jgi:hypothetical protein
MMSSYPSTHASGPSNLAFAVRQLVLGSLGKIPGHLTDDLVSLIRRVEFCAGETEQRIG